MKSTSWIYSQASDDWSEDIIAFVQLFPIIALNDVYTNVQLYIQIPHMKQYAHL